MCGPVAHIGESVGIGRKGSLTTLRYHMRRMNKREREFCSLPKTLVSRNEIAASDKKRELAYCTQHGTYQGQRQKMTNSGFKRGEDKHIGKNRRRRSDFAWATLRCVTM